MDNLCKYLTNVSDVNNIIIDYVKQLEYSETTKIRDAREALLWEMKSLRVTLNIYPYHFKPTILNILTEIHLHPDEGGIGDLIDAALLFYRLNDLNDTIRNHEKASRPPWSQYHPINNPDPGVICGPPDPLEPEVSPELDLTI